MKKIMLTFFLFIPFLLVAQNKITMKSGSSFVAKIDGLYGSSLVFYNDIPGSNADYVDINDVVKIEGKVPDYLVKGIKKKNHDVLIVRGEFSFDNANNNDEALNKTPYSYVFTSGDYLQRAGRRSYIGLGVSMGGAVITGFGLAQYQESLVYVGSGVSLIGLIISLTGPAQLIKAGKALNEEAITLTPSSQGLGLTINF